MKTITIYEDSWWDDNGCDCCEPMEMVYFTSDELSYTPSSEEYCLVDLLEKYNPLLEAEMKVLFDEETIETLMDNMDFLREELEKVGVLVKFKYMEDDNG